MICCAIGGGRGGGFGGVCICPFWAKISYLVVWLSWVGTIIEVDILDKMSLSSDVSSEVLLLTGFSPNARCVGLHESCMTV